jgi:hypothetical protein
VAAAAEADRVLAAGQLAADLLGLEAGELVEVVLAITSDW